MNWSPRTREDRMLLEYWRKVGGRIYTEVPLAGPRGDALWSADSTTRRLDAVRFPGHYGEHEILACATDLNGLLANVQREFSWLIEVKPKLNRTSIGQVIAGSDLFQKQYGIAPAKRVIVCAAGDAALEWVCERHFIEVVKVDGPPASDAAI